MTYRGSKQKLAKYICPIIQDCINKNNITTFVDIFVGGANIIKNIKCQNKIGVDNNKYLIALWQEMQKPNFEFPPTAPSREDWDRCKNGLEPNDWYTGLVSIFCSNLASGFPGGYEREHQRYNGRVKTCEKDLPLIKDITFICDDYLNCLHKYHNAVIYCDPPYENTRHYNYTKFDNDQFWDFARELSKDNFVFISEAQAPDDFTQLWETEVKNNLLNGETKVRTEKLFTKIASSK